jgi:hypothetical protein
MLALSGARVSIQAGSFFRLALSRLGTRGLFPSRLSQLHFVMTFRLLAQQCLHRQQGVFVYFRFVA